MSGRVVAYRIAVTSKFIFAVMSFLLPLTLKADPKVIGLRLGATAASALSWLQNWAWIALPCVVVISASSLAIARRLGDPTYREALHGILDAMRKMIFSGAASAASPYQHHHRVTLFQHRQWAWKFRCWPWSGWLLPVMRSGYTTQRCRSYFRAPDDPSLAEGIAGAAWNMMKGCAVKGLPDLSTGSSPADVEKYAVATRMSPRWTSIHKPQACSFYALKVMDKGKPWGVLVVDSKASEIDERKVLKAFTVEGQFLIFFGKRLAP